MGFNHEQQVFNSKHRDSTTNQCTMDMGLSERISSIHGNDKREFQVFKQWIQGVPCFQTNPHCIDFLDHRLSFATSEHKKVFGKGYETICILYIYIYTQLLYIYTQIIMLQLWDYPQRRIDLLRGI